MSIQYFFYKKTGEVVFDKTIITRKSSEKSNPNKVVEALYGSNQGKTYIVSSSQLTNITQTTPLNIWEKIQLKTAHLSKNNKRITDTIHNIKKVRNNQYPPKWIEFLIVDYGSDKVFDSDKINSPENSSESNSTECDNCDNENNIINPLNIFDLCITIPNPNLQLQLKKNETSKNEIKFEFQEYGGVVIQIVDFLTRIRWNLLLNSDEIIKIPLGSCIYFDKPFNKELLIHNELNLTKKELLEKIIEWTKENISNSSIQYDIDNFGLEKIEIVKNEKKQILNRFIIKYLYE
jgi:hypothetical protein